MSRNSGELRPDPSPGLAIKARSIRRMHQGQVTAAMHDRYDFNGLNRCVIPIRHSLIEDDLRRFDQNAAAGPGVRSSPPQARMDREPSDPIFNAVIKTFGSSRIMQPDRDIEVKKLLPRQLGPDDVGRHRSRRASPTQS